VLYAPSWENDNKQLEFINSLKDKNVNMLIKQYPASLELFPQQYYNIKEMEKVCKDMKDVYILDPKENIFTAIVLADILVSEESSTLVENMLVGKPSIAVTDWMIPDVNPPRLPQVPYDFIIRTEKKNIGQTISSVLNNYKQYQQDIIKYRDENFPYINNSANKVMDIIDHFVEGNNLNILPSPREKEKKLPSDIKAFYKKSRRNRIRNYISYRFIRKNPNKVILILYKIYKYFKK
jgi:CDP-glycerol glycerophosphotransferase (TagB/SpsB family)